MDSRFAFLLLLGCLTARLAATNGTSRSTKKLRKRPKTMQADVRLGNCSLGSILATRRVLDDEEQESFGNILGDYSVVTHSRERWCGGAQDLRLISLHICSFSGSGMACS